MARGIALIGMIAIHTMTSDDGDGNMSLWSVLAQDQRVRMVSTRHEAAAVAAADGYARTTGGLGVAGTPSAP